MTSQQYGGRPARLSLLLAVTLLLGCGDAGPGSVEALGPLASPAGPGSGEPYLASGPSALFLSWIEAVDDDAHELRFARWDGSEWSEPTTIVRGDDFFVNWADFPSISVGEDGVLWAHWLQRGAAGGYDYGVRVVKSTDGGGAWSEPWTPHDDDSPTEHGFVSTLPGPDGMGFVWLDGRKFAQAEDGSVPREMTLRYRAASSHGDHGPEMLIDGRVCDCCQTSSAVTADGAVVAYRNRTEDEIRDIYVARMVDGAWTEGIPVNDDGWETAACPVNGPAIVARGSDVAVAWFTAAGDVPRVKVAFSHDGGATFGEATIVDDGNPGGRVDLLLTDDGSALVSWLERTGGDQAEIRVRVVDADGSAGESAQVTTSSSERASGFPRMAVAPGGDVVLAWTDVSGEAPTIRISSLRLDQDRP